MGPKSQNRVLAGIVFVAALVIYLDTMAPTVSFWDCGEFIATSHILGVPHPPGSPLYLILGRIFSMIPFGDDIAFRVNLISPLVSALAVMFLYLIIVQFVGHWRGPVKSRVDRVVAFGSGLVGSLAFAFTDSHWFNAVEAEVYAVSTLFTAVVVWLILHWAERSNEPGNERYILIISYLLGLATGVHLLNLLALPFMGMIIYFKKRQFTWKSFFAMGGIVAATFLVIYLAIIKGFPKLATVIGVPGVLLLFVAFLGATVYVIARRYRMWSVILSSLLLVMIGYSTYSILFIRSNQDPAIDENDPETVGRAIKYLEREQYGSVSFLPRRYIKGQVGNPNHKVEKVGRPRRGRQFSASQDLQYMFHDFGRQLEFLWEYQIVRMYVRYFLWQFAGRGPAGERWVSSYGALPGRDEDGVNWIQFGLPLPLLLGLLGLFYHFKKDRNQAFSVLVLFFMTGLAVILYLNQDKFQPRERDYSYVGSFLAYSIWLGIGASAVLERVLSYVKKKPFRLAAAYGTVILLLLAVPAVMAVKSYHSHDRSGNFVAWDYSYNILQTCEPDGIIFTNGDNDTFPLWYLQEVEGIRKDVTVANLSLLNTEWYIRQLKESRPPGERFVNFTDAQIQGMEPIGRNPATGEPLFLDVSLWKKTTVSIPAPGDTLNKDGEIRWQVEPTMGQGIRVQDLMIIHIINEAKWKYPIYFAVTVSPKNRIALENYLQMEGLAFHLESHKVPLVNYERLRTNLTTVVGDDEWSRDYKPGYKYRNLSNADVYFNPNIIKLLQNYRSAFMELGFKELREYQEVRNSPVATDDDLQRALQEAREPVRLMETILPETVIPVSSEDMQVRLAYLYHQVGSEDKAIEFYRELHNSGRPEIVGSILRAYDEMGRMDEAIGLLQTWLKKNPGDSGVKRLLEEYRERKGQLPDSQ